MGAQGRCCWCKCHVLTSVDRSFFASLCTKMMQPLKGHALLVLAAVALAAATSNTTASCSSYTCPDGYKSKHFDGLRECGNDPCNLYDRDICCKKEGLPYWFYLLLALGICYCCMMCCSPLAALPMLGGKKKKKGSKRQSSASDSSYSEDYYPTQSQYPAQP